MTPDQINEIRVNPYKDDFPLLSRNADLAFLDSAATGAASRLRTRCAAFVLRDNER